MQIDVSDSVRCFIEANLASGRYRSAAEVVEDLVRERQQQEANDRRLAERQRQAIRQLQQRLAELPAANPDDGFSGRDHDRILYSRP